MKTNPNDPAQPLNNQMSLRIEGGYGIGDQHFSPMGLTKLEEFSARAMQGISANPELASSYTYSELAEASVKQAKALIAALNLEEE